MTRKVLYSAAWFALGALSLGVVALYIDKAGYLSQADAEVDHALRVYNAENAAKEAYCQRDFATAVKRLHELISVYHAFRDTSEYQYGYELALSYGQLSNVYSNLDESKLHGAYSDVSRAYFAESMQKPVEDVAAFVAKVDSAFCKRVSP